MKKECWTFCDSIFVIWHRLCYKCDGREAQVPVTQGIVLIRLFLKRIIPLLCFVNQILFKLDVSICFVCIVGPLAHWQNILASTLNLFRISSLIINLTLYLKHCQFNGKTSFDTVLLKSGEHLDSSLQFYNGYSIKLLVGINENRPMILLKNKAFIFNTSRR